MKALWEKQAQELLQREPAEGIEEIAEQFLILVTCRDEKEQVELLGAVSGGWLEVQGAGSVDCVCCSTWVECCRGPAMIDINEFRRNQSSFPREELEKYNGKYVAWSSDGKCILAADPDPVRVDALLSAAGYNPAEVLVSRVAYPEEVSWSGWSIPEDFSSP